VEGGVGLAVEQENLFLDSDDGRCLLFHGRFSILSGWSGILELPTAVVDDSVTALYTKGNQPLIRELHSMTCDWKIYYGIQKLHHRH
jgi:hypothetical protein